MTVLKFFQYVCSLLAIACLVFTYYQMMKSKNHDRE